MSGEPTKIEPSLVPRRSPDLPIILSVCAGTFLMLATLVVIFVMTFDHCGIYELGGLLLILAPSTCGLAMFVTWRCIRMNRTRYEATSTCLSGATLAGGLNVPLIVGVISVFTRGEEMVVMALFVSFFAGVVLGCPFGFIFGAACLRPIRLGASRLRSLDAHDVVSRTCGRWLVWLSFACVVLVGVSLAVLSGRQDGAWALILVCGLTACVGLVWSARAKRRQKTRREWLEGIRQGAEADWTIVALDEIAREGVDALPRFEQEADKVGATANPNALLARVLPPRDDGGAYRSADQLDPIALLSK